MSGEDEEKKSTDKVKGRKHRTSGFEEWVIVLWFSKYFVFLADCTYMI